VTNDEDSQAQTQTHQNEPILIVGMFRVVNEQSSFVEEDGLRLSEGDPVLLEV
jgi:hypothetical protein